MTLFLTDDQQGQLLGWAADRLGQPDFVADSRAIGVVEGERIKAVAVFNMFHDQGCWAHFASDGQRRWATHNILGGLFAYPFLHLGLVRITARCPISNIQAQIQLLRLGFQVEGREMHGFNGRDVAVFAMFAEGCPWLREGD